MIKASKQFREMVKRGGSFVNYADVLLRDGTELHLTPKDFMISGNGIIDKTSNGKFSIGSTIAKTATLKLANHKEQFSNYDFYKAIIYLFVAVEGSDGKIYKERKGKYYVTQPQTPGDIVELNTMIDSMYLFDKPYQAKTIFPNTLQQILSDCCLDCGVTIGFKQFDNYNLEVSTKPENVTYRQVVSYVAQLAGMNARISNDDKLELVEFKYPKDIDEKCYFGGHFMTTNENELIGGNFLDYTSENIIFGGNYLDRINDNEFDKNIKSLTVATNEVVITGVKVINGDIEYQSGTDDYNIEINDNPLSQGLESQLSTYLGDKLIGLKFRPFNANILNNPLIEPFDYCIIKDRKSNIYKSFVNSVNYNTSGYTQISCLAENPVINKSSYYSKAAEAVVQAKRNTEKQLSTYDQAVQNMNKIAMNSMGFHTTYEESEDGSRIVYLHDKINLEDSKIIYKQTIDGFFISEDGGKSYTSGFDSKGNVVVNVLSAIGITFDWAKGGTLTLGGLGNQNGKLVVTDASGQQIGKWDNTGITLPPSTRITWSQIDDADTNVTTITKNTVTTTYVNALNVKAGSVDAENITGTTITGKTISGSTINGSTIKGGSISIGSNFTVDSSGYLTAQNISALSGKIGGTLGLTITSNGIYTSNHSSFASTSTGVFVGNGGISVGSAFSVDEMGRVDIGSIGNIELSSSSHVKIGSGITLSQNGLYLSSSGAGGTHLNNTELKVGSSSTTYARIESTKISFGSVSGGSLYSGDSKIMSLTKNKLVINATTLGFFSKTGSTKQSVSTGSYSSVSQVGDKLNSLISALNSYGLV